MNLSVVKKMVKFKVRNFAGMKRQDLLTHTLQIAWVSVVLMLLGTCQNPNQEEPAPGHSYIIINTGSVFDSAIRTYKAACWIDKQFVPLASEREEETGAYGMTQHNQHLYIAGFYTQNEVMHPCYWDNGVQVKLPLETTDYWRATALDVAWFNNALYVLGTINMVPVLWIVREGKISKTLRLPNQPGGVPAEQRGSSRLCHFNNRLYIASAQQRLQQQALRYEVGYWTIDMAGHTTYTALEQNLAFSRVYFILANASGVWISGERNTADQSTRPVIWHNQTTIPAADKLDASHQRATGLGIDEGGNLYTILSNTALRPQIGQTAGPDYYAFTLLSTDIPNGAKGNCTSLCVVDNQIGYNCAYWLAGQFHAVYWLNGQRHALSVPEQYRFFIGLNSLRILPSN